MARLGVTAEQFVAKNFRNSLVGAGCFALLLMMLLDKMRGRELLSQNFLLSFLFFLFTFFMIYSFLMNTVEVYIRRQQGLLNRDVLFTGRYMLIKLQSGVPFYQALIDASNGGFGIASRYVREIVDDIELGTPIEQALSNAADLSPSAEFRQILWQINAALRSGVDVTSTLKGILSEISSQQVIEVERYGKKLATLALLYMLGAVIIPSLGLTLFVSFSGFLGLSIKFGHLLLVLFAIMFIQFMFLSFFRTIRPNINL
jgi:pilus assembly protein TadC